MTSELLLNVRPSLAPRSKIGEITQLGRSLGAVDLSQGYPDDDPPAEVIELFNEASRTRSNHQYAEPSGSPLLRRNLSQKLESSNGIVADPDREIIVTCGAREGLMSTFRSLFQPGEEILTFSPTYENYFHQAQAAQLRIRTIQLREPDFAVWRDQLEAGFSYAVRGVLICNPCNPTGKVFSCEELMWIVEFACRHNLLIISDETYERFIWRGTHISVATLPGARERTVTIASLGKTYSVTGWRVGYVVAPEDLMPAISSVHEMTTFGVSHPCQWALAHALELPPSFYVGLLSRYGERKDRLTQALIQSGFKPWEPNGAYFLWCDYSELAAEPDHLFSERLIRQVGIAGVPGQVFFPRFAENPKRIRVTFSKSLTTIRQAVDRLLVFKSNLFSKV
jgi:aspartate/methionine/tyrosine aminotransferase